MGACLVAVNCDHLSRHDLISFVVTKYYASCVAITIKIVLSVKRCVVD